MKQKLMILLFLGMFANQLLAQTDEFVIAKDKSSQNMIFVQCKTPELGVIIFTSIIDNVDFEIINSPLSLKNKSYDSKNKQYVLCVQPTEGRKYQINITHKDFKGEVLFIEEIHASEKIFFKIDSKNESITSKLDQKYNDNNLTIGVGNGVTCGALGAYSRFRLGGVVGAGIEGGIGLSDFDSKLMHWSAGVKFYPYKYWALSAHYGTLYTEKTDSYNSETGEFGIGGTKQYNGWSVLGGYDGIIFDLIHINTGIGFSYTDHVSFAWNIGIGFSLTGLFLKL